MDSGDETNEDEDEAEDMTQSFYQQELEKFIREKCIGVCTTPIWSSSEWMQVDSTSSTESTSESDSL